MVAIVVAHVVLIVYVLQLYIYIYIYIYIYMIWSMCIVDCVVYVGGHTSTYGSQVDSMNVCYASVMPMCVSLIVCDY